MPGSPAFELSEQPPFGQAEQIGSRCFIHNGVVGLIPANVVLRVWVAERVADQINLAFVQC